MHGTVMMTMMMMTMMTRMMMTMRMMMTLMNIEGVCEENRLVRALVLVLDLYLALVLVVYVP